MEEKQTKLFTETGTFFAFSDKQFEESKKEGIKYVSMGAGMICPKDQAKHLTEQLEKIYFDAIAQDIAENGIEKIIVRELHNHEYGYTFETEQTFDALKDYGITEEQILIEARKINWDNY
jgi:hypothetical protein